MPVSVGFAVAAVALAAAGAVLSGLMALPRASGQSTYAITCLAPNVEIGRTLSCSTNLPNPRWTVLSSVGGSISSDGTFSAPSYLTPGGFGGYSAPVTIEASNGSSTLYRAVNVFYTTPNLSFVCAPSSINFTQTSQCAGTVTEDGYQVPAGAYAGAFSFSLAAGSPGTLLPGLGGRAGATYETYVPPTGPFAGTITATVDARYADPETGRNAGLGSAQIAVSGSTSAGGNGSGSNAVRVTVLPQNAVLQPNQTQQYTATVTGISNQAVAWSVVCTGKYTPPCGTIDSSGLFTAPPQSPYGAVGTIGNMIVYATSVANPDKFADSYVTVVEPGTTRYDCAANRCVAGSAFGSLVSCEAVCGVAGGGAANDISVSSTNAVTGQPVVADWSFISYPAPPLDPCLAVYGGSCSGVSQSTYAMPAVSDFPENYTIQAGAAADPAGPYVFKGVFPAVSQSLSLLNPAGIHFNIEWDPVAEMAVTPSAVALGASAAAETLLVKDTGAPGSGITWTVEPSSVSWLSLDVAGGSSQWNQPGAVTVSAQTAGLADGVYTALLIFRGVSLPGSEGPLVQFVPVTLTVGGAASGGGLTGAPSCGAFSPNPPVVGSGGSSTLSWVCANVPPNGCSVSGVAGSFDGVSKVTVYPTKTTDYTLTCTGVGSGQGSGGKGSSGNTATATTTVIIGNPNIRETNPG